MRTRLVLTCEHAGKRVPREHAALFRGASRVLASHRGWDPGALTLARALGRATDVEVLACTWTRLLVEPNRSLGHPRLFSSYTRGLDAEQREQVVERYWRPHRARVERALDAAARKGRALHVAVHSFTPVLDGEPRPFEIGLLYDPRRRWERELARHWRALLRQAAPELRVRLNRPYKGTSDGLTTAERKRLPDRRYAGIELELNQAVLAGPRRAEVTRALVASLRGLLD